MRTQKHYDHRLRDLVRATGDIQVATRLGVPRSTASGWLRVKGRKVVSHAPSPRSRIELEAEVERLRRRLRLLTALLRAVLAAFQVLGPDLRRTRTVHGEARRRILRAIDRTGDLDHRDRILRLIGLSPARRRAWVRAEREVRHDDPDHPDEHGGLSPQRLTPNEVRAIGAMVTAVEYRHIPTSTLARLAQRLGRVFASASTWHRLVRERGWRRPRLRIHPARPELGVRAERPDQIWHIDTTLIRLVDGTRAYVHAVIDNFSRRILGCCVARTFSAASTVAILEQAIRGRADPESRPEVFVDAGVENCNGSVDALLAGESLRRVVAQVDLHFSNSMIEAWWRSLKHQWLFLNSLDSMTKLRRLVAFYVEEHNSRLPHSAFEGQTPDEMYRGQGEEVLASLLKARAEARERRLAEDRERARRARGEAIEAA